MALPPSAATMRPATTTPRSGGARLDYLAVELLDLSTGEAVHRAGHHENNEEADQRGGRGVGVDFADRREQVEQSVHEHRDEQEWKERDEPGPAPALLP